jgi:hypothetical protein
MASLNPLAQSFTVETPGGIYATSLDLFFSAVDYDLPVTVELRTMENGFPSNKILPFSRVTLSAQSLGMNNLFISISENATAPTRFTFEAPVHLLPNSEYCFVVYSNSDKYYLWSSEKFAYDITGIGLTGQGRKVIDNPFAGVMFKSSNASSWTPDQNRDIKFILNRAVFDSATKATVILNEDYSMQKRLNENPIETYANTNIVRVHHTNHGMFPMVGTIAKSSVILTMVQGNNGVVPATHLNGIPITQLNATHEVIDVEADSYTIRVATLATASGIGGGNKATATDYKPYNLIRPSIDAIIHPKTGAKWSMKGTTGQSLGGSEVPYTLDATYKQIDINKNIAMPVAYTVVPEVGRPEGLDRSLYVKGELSSTVNNVSPVIDLERTSAVVVANRIDNPAPMVQRFTTNATTASGATSIVMSSGGTSGVLAGYRVRGPYIPNNATVSSVDSGSNTIVISTGTTAIIPASSPIFFYPNTAGSNYVLNYANEQTPIGSSVLSKYITRKVELADPASEIKVYLLTNRPSGSNIDVYYKIQRSDDTDQKFDELPWYPVSPDSVNGVPYSDNPETYTEVEYTVGIAEFKTAFGLSPSAEDGDVQFTAFAIKIAFTSNNSSRVPSCKDFRAIAVS